MSCGSRQRPRSGPACVWWLTSPVGEEPWQPRRHWVCSGAEIRTGVTCRALPPRGPRWACFAEAGDGLPFVLLPATTGADLLALLDRVIRQVARRLAKKAASNDTDDV